MRSPADDLFRLIKSMTSPEKGYFKKMVIKKSGSDNVSLKLFEDIEKQTANQNYDESVIKLAFKDKKFVNNLHVAKNYLYNLILKSLIRFHSESSVSIKITDILNGAMILYKKGLYKESHNQVNKCKTLIYKNHADEYLFPVLKIERYLISILDQSAPENTFIGNAAEMGNAIEKMSNLKTYNELFGQLLSYYKEQQIVREEGKTKSLTAILNHPYIKNENLAITTESKVLFNKFFYNYNLSLSDDEKIFRYSKKMIAIIESNPFHQNEFLHEYISVLSGYLTSVTFLKNYEEADEAINKLKSINIISPYMEDIIYVIIYNFELIKFIQTGNFKEGIKLIPEVERRINNFEEKKKMLRYKFSYSIAYLYFGAGKYDKAIEWLNKIFNDNQTMIRHDLLSFAHILNLISHFELDNRDYLFYTIKNTYRFLYKHQKLYKVEAAVLNFLKIIPKVINVKDLMPHFKELRKNLIVITEDPYEKIALDYFDFISWLESKIQGKKFAEIVKSKR